MQNELADSCSRKISLRSEEGLQEDNEHAICSAFLFRRRMKKQPSSTHRCVEGADSLCFSMFSHTLSHSLESFYLRHRRRTDTNNAGIASCLILWTVHPTSTAVFPLEQYDPSFPTNTHRKSSLHTISKEMKRCMDPGT